MPEVSRFYGIVFKIYLNDHPPPHFHAIYGKETAKFDIDTLEVIVGELPNRATKLVKEWAALHQDELREAFERAANLQQPGKIDPLL